MDHLSNRCSIYYCFQLAGLGGNFNFVKPMTLYRPYKFEGSEPGIQQNHRCMFGASKRSLSLMQEIILLIFIVGIDK